MLAATLGSYAVTALATAVLALLPCIAGMARVDAVLAATLSNFAIVALLGALLPMLIPGGGG